VIKSYKVWLGLFVSLLFLILFLSQLDFAKTATEFSQADYRFLVPAVSIYFVALYFRTFRWRYLLYPIKILPVPNLYPIVIVGYMANNLLPMRLGELVRSYYLEKKEDVSKASSLATIAVERVFDGLTLLFLAAIASLFLPLINLLDGLGEGLGVNWVTLTTLMAMPFILVALFMVLAAYYPEKIDNLLGGLDQILPNTLGSRIKLIVNLFVEGLSALRDPKGIFLVFLISLPVWLLECLMYYLIGFSFGIDKIISPLEMIGMSLLVTSISNLATSLPTAGGGIGTFEASAAATLILLGVNPNIAGAYIILVHAALLLPVTLLGIIYLWFDNVSILGLTRDSQKL